MPNKPDWFQWLFQTGHPSSSSRQDFKARGKEEFANGPSSPDQVNTAPRFRGSPRSSEEDAAKHEAEEYVRPDSMSSTEPDFGLGEGRAKRNVSSSESTTSRANSKITEAGPENGSTTAAQRINTSKSDFRDLTLPRSAVPHAASSLPQRQRDGLTLRDWSAFISQHEKIIDRRISIGDARRDYLNTCQTLKGRLETFARLLRNAQEGNFTTVQEELLEQSKAISAALEDVDIVGSQQDKVEGDLLEDENALLQSAPVLFDKRGSRTFDLLRGHGFDFPGHAASIGPTASHGLSDLRDDLDPEVEEYFAKQREVDALEERLLELKHDQGWLDNAQHDSEGILDGEETFVVLHEHEVGKDALLQQLSQARVNLQAAKGVLPPADSRHGPETNTGESTLLGKTAMRGALISPTQLAGPSRSMDLSGLFAAPDMDSGDPSQTLSMRVIEADPERTSFIDSWLWHQVDESMDELQQGSLQSEEQPQYQDLCAARAAEEPVPIGPGYGTRFQEPHGATATNTPWSVQRNSAGTMVPINTSKSEGQLNLNIRQRRSLVALLPIEQDQHATARPGTASLPTTPTKIFESSETLAIGTDRDTDRHAS